MREEYEGERAMTEWTATEYARVSALQRAMADEVLSLLQLRGDERILDVGCGNGRTTSEIASRVPQGSVTGVDASANMIAFANEHYGPSVCPNLKFAVADARSLHFDHEFDRVLSFNALHWVPEQAEALQAIHGALRPDGLAQLRLVPMGARDSLEKVIEEIRLSPRWERYFSGFRDPYLRLTPEEYAELAEQNGFQVQSQHTQAKAWDFQTRAAFQAFGSVTFVAWTQRIPEAERPDFIEDVLNRYQRVAMDAPGEEHFFRFYQMDITLSPRKFVS
jgi:trans-aconitate 2-methyltransferase